MAFSRQTPMFLNGYFTIISVDSTNSSDYVHNPHSLDNHMELSCTASFLHYP